MGKSKALVLLSGGQDSTTCLYWAKTKYEHVIALNISYGQRHAIEIKAARQIATAEKIPIYNFNTDLFKLIGNSALLESNKDIKSIHKNNKNLPASFVPGRNIIFLTVAAMFAYKYQIQNIITGVCMTDYSGYPDCRDTTIEALEKTLTLGMECAFKIHAPLMHKTKKETVEMAMNLPGCMDALAYSHTCYEGKIPPCGKCPACKLREKGFSEAGVCDPLIKRLNGEKENG